MLLTVHKSDFSFKRFKDAKGLAMSELTIGIGSDGRDHMLASLLPILQGAPTCALEISEV